MILALSCLAAYLLGAIPFGLLAGKLKGIDVRQHGSGNIGATNVVRTVGKPAGITVLILDLLKGLLPVLLIPMFFAEAIPDWGRVLLALAPIIGHNYPIFLGFKGGKGIATSGGALLGLMPWAVGLALVVWLLLFFTTRYVAIASIGAAAAIPLAVVVRGFLGWGFAWPLLIFATVAASMAIWRHRSNITRLRAGEENRFEPKNKKTGENAPS